ncbi:MAG TPA: amino acid permease [Gemmatimonadaceae bacterium]|nr:amino acid permease [Gemmatimonadaceae bacterium]
MKDEGLIRAVGVRGLSAAIVNYTIGAGIFVLPALVAAKVGAAAPIVYVICAVAMGLIVACFADAGSRVSLSGGVYAYAGVAFGSYIGFMVAVGMWMSMIIASAAVTIIFLDSIGQLSPMLTSPLVRSTIIVVLYTILAVINVRGVKLGSGMVQTVTAGKLVPILILLAFGFLAVKASNLTWPGIPPASDASRATVILIFAFMGIESAITPSGEVKNPARTVPRAIFLAMILVTVLYIGLQILAQGILGTELMTAKAPLAQAAGRILGRGGEILVLTGAAISTIGYVTGDMLAAPRMPYSLGRDGLLPSILGNVHERNRTPHVAIILHAVLCAALALSGTFDTLAIFVVLLTLLVYLACCLATIQLQRRDVRIDGAEPLHLPGGPVIPILASLIIIWLMSSSTMKEVVALGGLLVASTIVYLAMRFFRAPVKVPAT